MGWDKHCIYLLHHLGSLPLLIWPWFTCNIFSCTESFSDTLFLYLLNKVHYLSNYLLLRKWYRSSPTVNSKVYSLVNWRSLERSGLPRKPVNLKLEQHSNAGAREVEAWREALLLSNNVNGASFCSLLFGWSFYWFFICNVGTIVPVSHSYLNIK